jgi:hypothetical protein
MSALKISSNAPTYSYLRLLRQAKTLSTDLGWSCKALVMPCQIVAGVHPEHIRLQALVTSTVDAVHKDLNIVVLR